MSDEPYKKKLIEVALPLDAINAESAREKSIRHGHPSTLHLWWARRPLAACRAVLFAQLVDDPSSDPERFPTEEDQDAERQRLFEIIERLVKWENSTNGEVLEEARAEIRRCFPDGPPPILDPFAGGGSIPLEAQRLGLEAHASDLNPVAVLINKALIEIPPKWAGMPPVHPEAENRTRWNGAEGLAEDVRHYGRWMRDEAEKRIGHLYPKATLPDGSKANVIAWIWARTVTCPNPACGATMPLVRSFWLGKKKGKEAWVKPVVEGAGVRFEIESGSTGPDPSGTVTRAGATCLVCQNSVAFKHIRSEGVAGRLGARLMAIAAEGHRRRHYLLPDQDQLGAESLAGVLDLPSAPLQSWPGRINPKAYGIELVADLFNAREQQMLATLCSLVSEFCSERADDPARTQYLSDIAVYLTLAIGKTANRSSTVSFWDSSASMEAVVQSFASRSLQMSWDYAEANPFSSSTGNLLSNVNAIAEVIERQCARGPRGTVAMADAASAEFHRAVVSTDPPYYDNVAYSDLSDFFYIWHRLALNGSKPEMYATTLTPKTPELVAHPYRDDQGAEAAEVFFEATFFRLFERLNRDVHIHELPLCVFYAFRQQEKLSSDGEASTGWSTMLQGLVDAGLSVVATWPVRTELTTNLKKKQSVLASSVVLACRQRSLTAGVTDRQGLVRTMREELPTPLRSLQKAHIAPVDLRQAAIGPGMAVFSRFAKVIEPDGSTMRVRTALGLINQVLDQVLGEQESEFDAETRWAIHWFSQFFGDEGPYGTAEQLAVSMNVAVSSMVEAGILVSGGGKARLLGRDELPDDWDPTKDLHTPVWEACQHLVKRLETDGEAAAARLLRRLGGLGESAQLLAYRLYTVCERARPALAGPYNALVASWPEIQRLARESSEPAAEFEQQSFDS